METIAIDLTWLDAEQAAGLPLPAYATALAAGMDVAAALAEDVELQPGAIGLIPCGFAVAIPEGYEIQVRPRSGLAVKRGITVVNAPGTIDADYRGEVKVALINLGREPFTIRRGDRIAQLILAPVVRAEVRLVASLAPTERGSGGFGHTGLACANRAVAGADDGR
ncbi:MAG: dUTP diphosphatase [Desulfobulbus sp.]|jgi:dUTP pyrophosphatase|uniref:dUTP diphosphatase n=1 Tax=Desulfobulbus sp. TaxID=895 RepID=UPI00284A7A6A|nr:dUTP diphosphatase [Desulfobulbus sp.]MDR2551394.1 dUTP diphosphatase [Desulfobulbus sp.]